MGSYIIYLSIIQDKDLVCMAYRRNPLSNDDLCHIRQVCFQSLTDLPLCSRVNGTGGVVQYQHSGTLQQSSGNT